jgi:hypothetical protein
MNLLTLRALRCRLLDNAKNARAVEHLDSRDDTEAITQAIALFGGQMRSPFAKVWCGARRHSSSVDVRHGRKVGPVSLPTPVPSAEPSLRRLECT